MPFSLIQLSPLADCFLCRRMLVSFASLPVFLVSDPNHYGQDQRQEALSLSLEKFYGLGSLIYSFHPFPLAFRVWREVHVCAVLLTLLKGPQWNLRKSMKDIKDGSE